MILGMHVMFYSSHAAELRAILRDKIGLAGSNVGEGWLIFDAPKADLGVHPTEVGGPPSGTADISFYYNNTEFHARMLARPHANQQRRGFARHWPSDG
jgi:hypothetical protein